MEMTLAMTDINDIKELYFKKGLNVAEIMRKTGHDRKTINKYLDMTDFNLVLEPPVRSKRGSKLDPFKETIDEWCSQWHRNHELLAADWAGGFC